MNKLVKKLQQAIRLTPSEVTILNYYLRIAQDGKFCCSRRTIAKAVELAVWDGTSDHPAGDNRTVLRANKKFRDLGILSWIPGNGRPQANQYMLDLQKIRELTLC
jgi:hypothetical protein